jgi:cytochrome c peroxidase
MSVINFALLATLTNPKIELGKTLFFDKRLSGDNKMSCATCHSPEYGWADNRKTPLGSDNKPLLRKAPTVAFLENDNIFFWDGRSSSLNDQAIIPLSNPKEMNQDLSELITELSDVNWYKDQFNIIYPNEGITVKNIIDSITTFEMSLDTRNSPLDKYLNGDKHAISEAAKNGFTTFSSLKANCLFCHKGNDFNDQKLWDTGVKGTDTGRNGKYLFKTPTLRNLSLRAPYFHNGSADTIEDVVRFYGRGGDVHRPNQADQQRQSIELTDQDIYELSEFLKSTNSDYSYFQLPKIPE